MSVDYFIDMGLVRVCDRPAHGSPADRGGADRYYGRPARPHFYPDGTYKGMRVTPPVMTPEQVQEYYNAYEEETERKQWD